MLEGRREQFVGRGGGGRGADALGPRAQLVDAAIDRWVWYAGWADKFAQVDGSANPVAGPYFNFSVPEPTGVVAVLAPQASSLLGLVSVVAPVIVSGNTCVVVASQRAAAAGGDAGRGAGHVRPARRRRQHPHRLRSPSWRRVLAAHLDVNAIDLTGAADRGAGRATSRSQAAENVKRVRAAPAAEPDWTADAEPAPDPGLLRDQDGLAPGRHLT